MLDYRHFSWFDFFLLLLTKLGLLWKNSDDFISKISYFFACFVATIVWLIEIVPGIHEEKLIFYRERAAKATTTFASWIAMGLPMIAISSFICLLFSIPAALIGGLQSDIEHFLKFFLIIYLGVIIHIAIQYLCAAISPSPMIHTLLFPGIIFPFEVK
jgi:hypothetical protein